MPKKMRTTRNLLLMATLLGSALFARAADKEMTIGAIYLDTQGYYAGVRQGVQDAAKDSSVQVQLIETNAQCRHLFHRADHQFNFRTGKRTRRFIKNDHARLALHHPCNFHQLLLRRA
jgi:hypothetical protein